MIRCSFEYQEAILQRIISSLYILSNFFVISDIGFFVSFDALIILSSISVIFDTYVTFYKYLNNRTSKSLTTAGLALPICA